ncbi:MAG: AAA family ATPase [Proteobacteria bacterium]|jgi:CO dehydrogenase maturation factor|nr:AAA family ATPase [Desulfobacterales bacterium]MBL6966907.1 AAA family ATPase [Desulfobacteraceae bacterium]MBL7172468.1 AAA family ATPase [Desulfobacteraceae bacterium]MBU0733542.1 AAA family ATPase [Pseudomonadota bacterium]MBU1904608.1 AAA family ATPase [Pseudomonadota bacterium]
MTYSVALAGKGGTGKTTMAGMLVKYLVEKGKTPVLAVDADANANLNEVLGLDVEETLGDAREEMKKNVSTGMTKDVFMEMKLQQAVIEASGFDLIVMGRPEGAGCYCAANTLLTQCLDNLINNYNFIVIDNEAGMEHISRLTTNNIDALLVVSDPTRRGLQAAARIIELTDKLSLNIGRKMVMVNRVRDENSEALGRALAEYKLDLVGMVPEDTDVQKFDLDGRPTIDLTRENQAVKAAYRIFDSIIGN